MFILNGSVHQQRGIWAGEIDGANTHITRKNCSDELLLCLQLQDVEFWSLAAVASLNSAHLTDQAVLKYLRLKAKIFHKEPKIQDQGQKINFSLVALFLSFFLSLSFYLLALMQKSTVLFQNCSNGKTLFTTQNNWYKCHQSLHVQRQCSLDLISISFGIYLCVWSLLLSDKHDSGARYTGCFLSNKQNGAFTWGACTAG